MFRYSSFLIAITLTFTVWSCSQTPSLTLERPPDQEVPDTLVFENAVVNDTVALRPFDTSAAIVLDSAKYLEDETATVAEPDSSLIDSLQIGDNQDPAEPVPVVSNEVIIEKPGPDLPSKPARPVVSPGTKPTPKPGPAKPKEPDFNYRNLNKNAYQTGEKLTFDIRYGLIVAGIGTMSVDKEFDYKNREVQRVFFEAKSTPSFSWIYKVQNQYISYLDKYGIYPWKYIQKTREGSYKRDIEVEFDQVRGLAFEKSKQYSIPPYTHDIISAFFYFRNLDLKSAKAGDIIKLSNYSKGKVFPLDVIIRGWQRITVPAGTFNCVVLEPLVKAGGLFKNEGTLMVWLTNDEFKIPVKVETKVLIGSINVELVKAEGVSRIIPARVK